MNVYIAITMFLFTLFSDNDTSSDSQKKAGWFQKRKKKKRNVN